MFDTLLAKAFTIFAQVMVKIQPIWDKYKLLISITLGVIIGLIIGWGLFPVEWQNATPGHLRADYRSYYLAQVAEDYIRTADVEMVKEKLGLDLPKTRHIPWLAKKDTLANDIETAIAQADRFGIGGDQIIALQRLAQDLPSITGTAQPVAGQEGEAQTGIGSMLKTLATLVVILLLVLGIVAAAWFLLIGRRQTQAEPVREKVSGVTEERGARAAEAGVGVAVAPPPVKSFTTTYVLGDDYFDPSFSIEIGPDFLGECGIGISETLGAGDPKKITAFEAWLFDKSDIRTVTTVLASEYAFNDPDLRAKLEPKGDIQMLQVGKELTLETTALRVKVRVKELEYAQGNLPAHSFIQKISFELRSWVKQTGQPMYTDEV